MDARGFEDAAGVQVGRTTVKRVRPPGAPSSFGGGQQAEQAPARFEGKGDLRSSPSSRSTGASGRPFLPARGRRRRVSRMARASSQAAQSPLSPGASSSANTRSAPGAAAFQGEPPPYSHRALTGGRPRAARASLTGWSCHAICISLSSRRQGRVWASWRHQSFRRCPATARGLAVWGRRPSGRRRRQRSGDSGSTAKPVSSKRGRAVSSRAAVSSARRSIMPGSSRVAWSVPSARWTSSASQTGSPPAAGAPASRGPRPAPCSRPASGA